MMAGRSLYRTLLRARPTVRMLMLEPSGMCLELPAGEELVIEAMADDDPELELDGDDVTVYVGAGAEVRVLRGDQELYSSFGNPVPELPPGMSTRDFLTVIGLRSK